MYPTKNMHDYMTEMNRFPRIPGDNDMFQSPLTRTHSFSHSTMAHSSSSNETSPDSFPDLAPQLPPEFRPEEARKPSLYQRYPQWRPEEHFRPNIRPDIEVYKTENHFEGHIRPFEHVHSDPLNHRPDINNLMSGVYETPLIRRPIIGRKIMARTETPLKTINEFPIWQPDLHTPPKSEYMPNYKLFPENQGFDFHSPIKTPHTSPQLRTSPHVPLSPKSITPPPRSSFSPRMTLFKEPMMGPSCYGSSKMCTFCRKNGETPVVYMTHAVKEKIGNKHVVTCPILRSHVCSTCGASGDNAHTITYCPVLRSGNNGQPLQSTTITLKNTRVKSNGRRRY